MTLSSDVTTLIDAYTNNQDALLAAEKKRTTELASSFGALSTENLELKAQVASLVSEITRLNALLIQYDPVALEMARRTALVPGVDFGSATNSGLIDKKAKFEVRAGRPTLTDGGTYRNVNFSESVIIKSKCNFINCIFGPPKNPNVSTACVIGDTKEGLYGSTFQHCLIDGQGLNAWVNGIFLCNATIRYCEITRVVDCYSLVHALDRPTLSELNYLHDTTQFKGTAGGINSDGVTHNDGAQGHRGRNYTMRGDYITGIQAECLQFQQQVSTSAADRLDNILIDRCKFGTGYYNAGIRLHIALGNDLSGLTINKPVFEKTSKPAILITKGVNAKIIDPRYVDGTVANIVTA